MPRQRAVNGSSGTRALIKYLVDKLGSADDIDGPEALLFCEYDYGSPDPGICGVLNNPITGLQGNELLEKQCGRRRIDTEHRRLLAIDLGRQHDHFFSRRQYLLRPGEHTTRDHDTVAYLDG